MNSRIVFSAIALLASLAAPVRAHFLFVRILPPAEGGRAAEVYFSELAEAGDPRFVGKIAHTQLWLQTAPGKFESLKVHKAPDRLRAWLPYTGNLMVVGECRYGVLARPKETPFLLRHYPKAIAGNPDALSKLPPHGKLPLEIAVIVDGDRLRLTALRNGKPVPNAEFVTIDAQLKNTKLTADADGQATWKPPTSGDYSIYTRFTSKEAGEFGGKKYEEIRDFATVAFTWPLERKDADADAVARFEEALATRAAWKNFPGFTARIVGNLEGRSFAGAIAVDAQGKVDFTDDAVDGNDAVSSWVQDQFESIVLHRLARPASGEARKPVLRFGESNDDNPLGRLLIFDGGQFASGYRVKDKQILVVNRHIGKENMTITVLDNDRNAEGLFLPRSYTVQYWDAASGELKRIETVQQRWQRLGSWDLPSQQTVTTATAAGLSVRSFTLTKHQLAKDEPKAGVKHYLYAVAPGIRDYLEFGGSGILVFDIDDGHKFVKRIETIASREAKPDNIKGVCANAATKKLYFTTTKKLYCVDLVTEKTLWEKALPQGCDRMSMTPDGKVLYVPSFEKDIWNVVDGANGDVLATIETKSGAHNTVVGLDGSRMYLAGLRSPLLTVADTQTHKVVKTAGPFAAAIRPFTVNAAQTLCFVNVNDLLGFEIGDLKTGKKLSRVEIQGFEKGPVKRHGCPSHGIGLTPDEKEIWVCDGHNSHVHVFDATVMPPKQIASIKLREQPGWVTFSLDGRLAYPSTGEVIDVKTKKIVAALADEKNREVHSEKMVEIHFKDGVPIRTGDQFGVGRATAK